MKKNRVSEDVQSVSDVRNIAHPITRNKIRGKWKIIMNVTKKTMYVDTRFRG